MPRRVLDAEIAAARRERDEADRKLKILLEAQRALLDETVAAETERLHDSHSGRTLPFVQEESSHSIGVRIAAGRGHQSKSRQAQIAAGLTDKVVADLTGYSRTAVCKWHNGTMKIPEEAQKLLAKRGIPRASWSNR